jgi:hypothetical protein
MGCDIHIHSEVKINGKWEHLSEIEMDRSYEVFGYMVAGHSRSYKLDEKPLAKERGLPDDINILTKVLLNSNAEHTFSWLNSKETEKLYQKYFEKEKLDLWIHNLQGIRFSYFDYDNGFLESNIDEIEDFRIIFGFDN